MGKWKAYLPFEESNPLEIEEKDRLHTHSRCIQESCHPNVIIWYEIIPILFLLVLLVKKELADVHTTCDKFLTLLRSQLGTLELLQISHYHPRLQLILTAAQEMVSSATTTETGAGAQSNSSSFQYSV